MKDQPTSTPACGGMRVLSKTVTLTRRGFLQGGAAALGAVAAGPAALAASGPDALARTFPTLGGATAHTLVRMARDVFPHDRLADRYYVDAIVPLERAAHADKAQAALLKDGVRALDKAAHARYGKAYAAVKREPERVALLKTIETTPFFERVRSEMVTSLYDNKAVWPLLGYEGSSWEQGGYLHRGFNDIDWL